MESMPKDALPSDSAMDAPGTPPTGRPGTLRGESKRASSRSKRSSVAAESKRVESKRLVRAAVPAPAIATLTSVAATANGKFTPPPTRQAPAGTPTGCEPNASRQLSPQVLSAVRRTHELFRGAAASRTLKYKANEVVVSSGSKFEFPIRIEQGQAIVNWRFQVKGGDIAFSVRCAGGGERSGGGSPALSRSSSRSSVLTVTPATSGSGSAGARGASARTRQGAHNGGSGAGGTGGGGGDDDDGSGGGGDAYALAARASAAVAAEAAAVAAESGEGGGGGGGEPAQACVDLGRVGSGNMVVTGHVDVPAGTQQVFIVWDNSFSWWTPKTLRYSVHLQYTRCGRGGSQQNSMPSGAPGVSAGLAASAGGGNADGEQRRNEMLVTLCTVMRQLQDNRQKMLDLGRWHSAEQQALADLKAKRGALEMALTVQKATEKSVLDKEAQLQGTMNALLLQGLSQRAKRTVLGFLSARDLRAWKCTTLKWKEFWQ